MKNTYLILMLLFAVVYTSKAQRTIVVDTTIITHHNTTINGNKISYTAKTGTQPVWDKGGKPIATLFYTYYREPIPGIWQSGP